MTEELPVQRTQKRTLQKIAKFISYFSVFTAIGCAIFLLTIDKEQIVMRASIGATSFFFFMVGLVLHTIGATDLPNLKVEQK